MELTDETFAYGASQQDLRTGRARIFAVQELLWVRAEEECKFTVRLAAG